ncbi:hypothetical protein ABT237_19215 [Streptomyces sp. NPDC001581]|uniref:hypothetical protein n=1 Tax=Streptomyces sp. NPDC001581 TaxID=3154386 RepID=UPI00333239C3
MEWHPGGGIGCADLLLGRLLQRHDGVRQFVTTNSAVLTTVALLLLGAGILGDGLTGLGR